MGNVNSSGSSAGPVRHDRVRGRPVPSQTPELENSRPGLTRSRSSLSLRSCTTATTSVSPWARFKRFLSVPASLLGEQQQESTEPAVEAMEETSEAKEVLEEDFVLVPGMDLKLMSTEIKQIAEGDPFARHPVLVDPEAIAWVRTHGKIVFIMRGLPGSGKSTLVNKLSKLYSALDPLICSADHFFMDPDTGEYAFDQSRLQEAHASSQERFKAGVAEGRPLIIVDNTNVVKWEMNVYFKVAHNAGYQVLLLEPQTPWKLDPAVLAEKNSHGVNEEVLRKKVRQFKPILSLYFAWFANRPDSQVILDTGLKWLERCLTTCQAFNKDFCAFSSMINLPSQLNYYSRNECQPSNRDKVHCTARFCHRNEAEANLEYISRPEVIQSLGAMFKILVIGFVITKDTLGARVLLTPTEIPLWGQSDSDPENSSTKLGATSNKKGTGSKRQKAAAEAKAKKPSARERRRLEEEEKERLENQEAIEWESENKASSWPAKDELGSVKVEDNDRFGEGGTRFYPIPGTGRRAHLTLGTRDGVMPVTTGTDLLEAVMAEKAASDQEEGQEVNSFNIEGAVLRQYADGLWVLYPDKRWVLPAMFTGHYI